MTQGKQLGTSQIAFDTSLDIDFNGKVFVLTGDFASGSKSDIEVKIVACGGSVNDSVTGKTNVVVVGNDGSAAWVNGVAGGKKVEKAMELKAKGNAIVIMSETQLIKEINRS